MDSLFSKISSQVQDGELLSLITDQVGKVGQAGDTITNITENPPQGLEQLTGFLRDLSLPDLDKSGQLNDGISRLFELVPTDTSTLTGDLSKNLENFFDDLTGNLVDQLSGIIQSFEAIDDLVKLFNQNEVNNNGIASLGAMASGEQGGSESIQESLDNLQSFLDKLPETFSVSTIFERLLKLLDKLPRNLIPVRNLPLIDELRDKLETVLQWKAQSGAELTQTLENNVVALNQYIRSMLIEELETNADELRHISDQVNYNDIEDQLVTLTSGLNNLASQVRSADLAGTSTTVIDLNQAVSQLNVLMQQINDELLQGQQSTIQNKLDKLGDRLDQQMLELIANLNPTSDLEIVSLLLKPVDEALEATGFEDGIDKINEFLDQVRAVFNRININSFKDEFQDVIDTAVDGVDDLKKSLINVTLQLKLLLDRVENELDNLGIEAIINEMENGLRSLQQSLESGANAIFEPVKNFLGDTLDTINGFLDDFDPEVVIGELRKVIQVLTNILSDPVLLDTIDKVKGALDEVNGSLEEFSFQPVTDTVVEAINTVKDILGTLDSLPIPDSMEPMVSKAFEVLPESIEPATTAINNGLEEIINEGPKPVLETIKAQPVKLVTEVKKYSPDILIGDKLSAPYQEVVGKMEEFKPSVLLQPVNDELNDLKNRLSKAFNPAELVQPLEAPFNSSIELLNQFDPNELIQPLQEQITNGITAVTGQLPLDETNEVFDKIQEVTEQIEEVVALAQDMVDTFTNAKNRLGGLQDAGNQVSDFNNEVVSKLDEITDVSGINLAYSELAATLDQTKSGALLPLIIPDIDGVVANLSELDAGNKLIDLVAAHRGFPKTELNALPDSPEKTAILNFINGFDPLGNDFTVPLNSLSTWQQNLSASKINFQDAMSGWDARFHGDNSPLNDLRQTNLTVKQLKNILSETLEKEFLQVFTPVMKVIDHLQQFFSFLLDAAADLVQDLTDQVSDFLSIADTLEQLRNSINSLVTSLEEFDISFIADEIRDVFDGLINKMEILRPSKIAGILDLAFDDLLSILDLNQLLGTDQLEQDYLQVLNHLRKLDPGTLVTDLLQPEFDKVVNFLERFDLTEQIDTFLERIETLKQQLADELERTSKAFDQMIDNVPAEFQEALR